MNNLNILQSFVRLKIYCESESFKGWDPYDGLNSRLAHAILPLKKSAFLRLCVIQGFKRCPVNLRRIALVPKAYNSKGIGLFLQGYCNLYRTLQVAKSKDLESAIGSEEQILEKIRFLADLLIDLRSEGDYHGACWGYNFDWQAWGGLYFPAFTPTVVATNFCATALMDAYEVTGEKRYLDIALTSAEFVLQDLHRYYPLPEDKNMFLFSYSKLPGNDTVFNASLLGSRLLVYCYRYTGKQEYLEAARASIRACVAGQAEDGSWVYGLRPRQNWIDSFHTGYNLDGLAAYEELTGDVSFHKTLERGFEFYINHFFEADGMPKYYHNKTYPIDIHCPGQLFVTLSRLHRFEDNALLAENVMDWTLRNMQSRKGYFYYQLKMGWSSKISYMRWSNAFMFCAMSYYITESLNLSDNATGRQG